MRSFPRTRQSLSQVLLRSLSSSVTLSHTMTTTFHLPSTSPSVPVHIPSESLHTATASESELLNFPAFKTWLATLQRSLSLQQSQSNHEFHNDAYVLRNITIQCVDRFGGGRIGFIKLKAEISNSSGESLPGSVFLRGGSIAMLITLQPNDVPADTERDKHVLLTVQPRVPAGTLAMAELPAGMLDDAGTFAGAAAKEIEEETSLKIPISQLTDLTALALPESSDGLQKGVYTSCGGQDEFVPIFLHQRRVDRAELDKWTGKLTGLREHGEKITLKCMRLDSLWRECSRDAKALCAWSLYHGLQTAGKL